MHRLHGLAWTFWAVIFGLLFALVFVTKFTEITHPRDVRDWALLVQTVLFAVGCVACIKLARQSFGRVDQRVDSN